MDTRIGQEYLILLGLKAANLVISGKTVRVPAFFLQGCQGGRSDTRAARGEGPLRAQGVV